jgi:hypothetical protein
MAKPTKSNGSFTVYSLRRIAGMPARRPSAFNACVAARLKGKKYPKPAPGMGGRHNKQLHADFKAAVQACRGQGGSSRTFVTPAERRFEREESRGG